MSLTSAQKKAIAARGNVLVIAGAGTGKTRTLVERCLSCLLDENPPASLEQILMVTFTEAAAAEMRLRIRARLEEQSKRHPNVLRWHEHLALFDTAYIGTLHSFCLQLIRPHFYELELDPQLSVLAEEEARLLADETLTSVLEGHYAGHAPGAEIVQQLIQAQGTGSDQPIRALILKLHHYTQTLPNPRDWFEDQLALFAAPHPRQWQEWLRHGFSDWRAQSLSWLQTNLDNPIAAKCAVNLEEIPAKPSREQMAAALDRIVTDYAQCPRGTKAQLLGPLEQFLADAQFLVSLAASGGKIDPLAEDWEWVRAQMMTLLQLARQFGDAFGENKRQLGMLDFHDLEQYTLRLLWDNQAQQPTDIALQWQKKLRFVFVDEYQDINAAQDRIISTLSGTGPKANRFLVGDVKQSIYRFRLANPYIFQQYARTWRDGLGQTIPLVENFRSREPLLEFINSLFQQLMRADFGGIAYDEEARLRFGAPAERHVLSAAANPGPCVELCWRIKRTAADLELNEPADDAAAEVLELEEVDKEARLVALRLAELKAQRQPIWDEPTKQFRPVEWRDMAILLRSPVNKAESFAKEFARLHVPLLVQRGGFYDSIEVIDLVNLLQTLDNPLQDVPVLGVLHSPLAGLSVNELATIRLAAKGSFWTALVLWHANRKSKVQNQKAEGKGHETKEADDQSRIANREGPFANDETFRKVSTFLARYARWRRLARQNSLSRCLEAVLTETHYDTWLLTRPRGEQRHANVQRFLRLAQQFDNFQRQGLFRFLCFIQAQQRADTEPEVKPIGAENAVRLMSIHQSKGLEFPVVVVADLGKPFNLADLQAAIILDEEYGLCPQIKPPHTGKRYPSLPYWLARRRQRRELLGEELRLLYVAMTRARDYLLLTASVSEKKLRSFCTKQSAPEASANARGVADWLGLWFAEHCSGSGFNAAGPHNQPGCAPMPNFGENKFLRWSIHDEATLVGPATEIENEQPEPALEASPEVWSLLEQKLSWQYPFLPATRTLAKASVTALRRRAAERLDEEFFDLQFFGEAPSPSSVRLDSAPSPKPGLGVSTADAGRAHHKFLQLLSLECVVSVEELNREARRLERELALTKEEVALLNLEALAIFWTSELGRSIRAQAQFVKRELAFTARLSPPTVSALTGQAVEETLRHEFLVVQGVADLVVLKPNELWLLDFKTDAITGGNLNLKVRLYEPQMRLYARALAQIYHRPVSASWLYFLDCQKAVRVAVESPSYLPA